jgi:hypothetical protein
MSYIDITPQVRQKQLFLHLHNPLQISKAGWCDGCRRLAACNELASTMFAGKAFRKGKFPGGGMKAYFPPRISFSFPSPFSRLDSFADSTELRLPSSSRLTFNTGRKGRAFCPSPSTEETLGL